MTDLPAWHAPPEAPDLPEPLTLRLREALRAMPASYRPRTHHLLPGDAPRPRFTNRLILETSPYLLQHAHNPVNWYPWGDEAFEAARRENKPVFLSIGYATCHWCHVMERESFEDLEIAAALNRMYVCIKVDREERPDVDAVYMAAVQRLTGGGGWPMSVWLTADREPFMGGTYFPPRAGVRGMRRGFLELIHDLRATFDQDPTRIAEAARSLTEAVRHSLEGPKLAGALADVTAIDQTVLHYARLFDRVNGGLRRAPKFPSHVPVRLLLRHHARTGDAQSLEMATLTLEKMAAGGMYDQVAGGFHRYSTDSLWLVPHFEKMLYDNALLTVAYAEAHQATGRPVFARIVREVLTYVSREMTSPEGGFFSATDADSEGEEGKFFVWKKAELEAILGADAELFIRHYGVTDAGSFEGANILHVPEPDEATWKRLVSARQRLYEVRSQREAPLRDDKILAAWNGLMISAFAVGGRMLAEPSFITAATGAAEFVLSKMYGQEGLRRSYKDGRTLAHAFLEDYAFMVQALLDLFESAFEPRFLARAVELAEEMESRFADAEGGGWFSTAHDGETLLAREKPDYDGAEPSGTSVALMNALRLHALTGKDEWRQIADRGFGAVAAVLKDNGPALTQALVALDFRLHPVREVAIVWPDGCEAEAEPFLAALRSRFLPHHVVAAGAVSALPALLPHASFVEGKIPIDGKVTAYVCEQGRCERPTHDLATLLRQLGAST